MGEEHLAGHTATRPHLVSSAFRGLLRGCCSKQLTAGLPATGMVIALSTSEVMACTARTLIWVLSVSSWKDSPHIGESRAARHQHHLCPQRHTGPKVQGSQTTRPRGKEPRAPQKDKPSQPGLFCLPRLTTACTHWSPETNVMPNVSFSEQGLPQAQTSKQELLLKKLPLRFPLILGTLTVATYLCLRVNLKTTLKVLTSIYLHFELSPPPELRT